MTDPERIRAFFDELFDRVNVYGRGAAGTAGAVGTAGTR